MTTARRRSARRSDLARIEDLLVHLVVLRRQPAYRQVLAEGTGLAGRVATVRLLRALDALTKEGNKPSLADVSERIGIEQSNASRVVDDAVRRGLIVKTQSQDDARRLELTLTKQGKSVIVQIDTRRDKVNRQLFEEWSDHEVESLIDLLKKLGDSYETIV